jgi:beta-1,4-mannosyltransferase
MIRAGIAPYSPKDPYQILFREALESAGVEVVPVLDRRRVPVGEIKGAGVQVLHLDWPHGFYTGRTWYWEVAKRLAFRRSLRMLPPVKLVWTVHNLVMHDGGASRKEVEMIQHLIDHCSALRVMSAAAERLVRQTYRVPERTPVRIIPLGHHADFYPNQVGRAEARRRLGLADARRIVTFFGLLKPYKGLDQLLDVWPSVAGQDDVLVLAGAPASVSTVDLATMIERATAAGARVRLDARYIPEDEVQLYLNAADVVALPFRNILNSGSLLLAMSFGRCVVAPRMGSLPEVAEPDSYFSYDPLDAGGLRSALHEALACDDLPRRGQAAREYALRHYSWKEIGLKTRQLYEEVLNVAPR